MHRVISYIDGFNLYYGLRSKAWRRYYWLDLVALSKALLKPDQLWGEAHYFTSRIRHDGTNADDARRQSIYLDALANSPDLTIHEGHFLQKPQRCHACGATWMSYEEKMTDVNLAVRLLADAFDDRFDTALIVSGDSDLSTPVKQVRARFAGKRVVVAFPPGRHSNELGKAATGFFTIGEAKIRASQSPERVVLTNGHAIDRPTHWR